MIKIGEIYTTNEGCSFEVINYTSALDIDIYFKATDYTRKVRASNIRSGGIKNPYHKSVLEVGFVGVGPHKVSVSNKNTREYLTWFRMMRRCYDVSSTEYPAYGGKGVYVDPQWYNFQEFAEWCQWQVEFKNEDWQLDKDILKVSETKYYSPETCCFVPRKLNNLFRTKPPKGYNSRMQVYYKSEYITTCKTPEEANMVYRTLWLNDVKAISLEFKGSLSNRLLEYLQNTEVC